MREELKNVKYRSITSYRSCSFCIHENEEDENGEEYCEGCSSLYGDRSCSCHTGNPPCSFCENSKFEETPYLIKYLQIIKYSNQESYYKKWLGIKVEKNVYDNLKAFEKKGFYLITESGPILKIVISLESIKEVFSTCLSTATMMNILKEDLCNFILKNDPNKIRDILPVKSKFEILDI